MNINEMICSQSLCCFKNIYSILHPQIQISFSVIFYQPLWAQWGFAMSAMLKKILQTDFLYNALIFFSKQTKHSRSEIAKEYSQSASVALCGSKLVVSSPWVLQEEIRCPTLPTTSSLTGPPYNWSQISISPAGCLEIPGDRKKINAWPGSLNTLEVFHLISITSY